MTVNGYRLGTLCIVDQNPRNFTQEDAALLKDLAATIESELSAMQMATHDELTGILNRRGFLSLAQNNLNLSIRTEFPVTLIYFDLDDFKLINDNYGHAIGDDVLISFAQLLNNKLQSSDIFARLSGDEFALLLNNTGQGEALTLIEECKHLIKQYHHEAGNQFDVSFSFGVVEFNHTKHVSIKSLLSDADEKMYFFKNSRKK